MTRVVSLRTSTDRYVLLLKTPADVYWSTLDGQQTQRVDAQIEKFLEEATPESALQPEPKFPSPLRQLKDRGGNIRALGVWCQGEGYDLFVVQILYTKGTEDEYLPQRYMFAERGEDLQAEFGDRDQDDIAAKAQKWRANEDLLLVTPEDLLGVLDWLREGEPCRSQRAVETHRRAPTTRARTPTRSRPTRPAPRRSPWGPTGRGIDSSRPATTRSRTWSSSPIPG